MRNHPQIALDVIATEFAHLSRGVMEENSRRENVQNHGDDSSHKLNLQTICILRKT